MAGAEKFEYDPLQNVSLIDFGGSSKPGAVSVVQTVAANGTGTQATTQDGQTTTTSFSDAKAAFSAIGGAFGSSLGNILMAGNDQFAQIATSAALGTVLTDVGQVLGDQLQTDGGANLIGDIGTAIDNLGPSLLNSFEGAGTGALGSFLVGDLLNALGLSTTSLPGKFLDSVTSTTVGTIASNLVNEVAGVTNPATHAIYAWNDGLTSNFFGSTIGSFIGAEVGSLIYTPTTAEGAAGSQVGTVVGSLGGIWAAGGFAATAPTDAAAIFGTTLIDSIVLPGIGALLGFVLGGVIGDWIGHVTPQAFANIHGVTSSTGTSYVLSSYYDQDGGNQNTATSLGTAAVAELNSVLMVVGGSVTTWAQPYGNQSPIGFGIGTYTQNNTLMLTYQINYGQQWFWNPNSVTLDNVIAFAVMNQLSQMVFTGGDPYMIRAIDAALRSSTNPTLATLSGDIQIAKDYENYVANASTINALIAANPNSAFATSWVAELAVAAEMGYGTSVEGSAENDAIDATSAHPVLIGGGGYDVYHYSAGDGTVTILNGVSSDNVMLGNLRFDSGITALSQLSFTHSGADLIIDVAGSATDKITVEGWYAGSFAQLQYFQIGSGNTTLIAGTYVAATATQLGVASTNAYVTTSNVVTAGVGDDDLTGSTSGNVFILGGGNDEARGGGGAGYDTYEMNAPGTLLIINGTSTSPGPNGQLQFGAGVTANQLSFSDNDNMRVQARIRIGSRMSAW